MHIFPNICEKLQQDKKALRIKMFMGYAYLIMSADHVKA